MEAYGSGRAGDKHPEDQVPPLGPQISVDSFSEDEIVLAAKKLSNRQTAGPDLIPSFLAKDCIGVLARPLTFLFNLCLKESEFPAVWREGRVTPVFKSGEKTSVENYRPITIINTFAKLFEIALYNRIYPSVEPLLSEFQHGFIGNRSTITNLCSLVQFACETVDGGSQVDIVYADFAKAFDRVDHCTLLYKFTKYGFSPKLVELIASYLYKRKQYVLYNGFKSPAYEAPSGVPQGSNLAPLFFAIFINDLPEYVQFSRKLLYADDVKLYARIDSEVDSENLQSDLDKLGRWCTINKLELNISKCCILTLTKKRDL